MRGVDDYGLWLGLAAAGVTFGYVPTTSVYRVHQAAMSADRVGMAAARLALFEKLAGESAGTQIGVFRSGLRRERRVLAVALGGVVVR